MAGERPHEAVRSYLAPIQKALRCVVDSKFTTSGYETGRPQTATLHRAEPAPLKGVRLKLEVSQQFAIVEADGERGPWKVHTLGYWYAIVTNRGKEVLAYHRHPDGDSDVAFPHLHLGNDELSETSRISHKTHIPTARVAVEDVVVLAIELGAKPLQDDWATTLEETRSLFRKYATWG